MMEFLTAIIILVSVLIGYFFGHKVGAILRDKYWEKNLKLHRKDAIMKSRAVLSGHFSEQLAPFLPDFPFKPNEVRFIGKPVDFIAFKGMDGKHIEEVSFIEVKSGKSKLNATEKSLKEAVQKGKVKWEEYRVPEEVTKGKDLDFEKE